MKLLPYWKPVVAVAAFVIYSFTLNSCAVDRTNDAWEIKDAARVEAELKAKNKALSDAAELKRAQDNAAAAREEQLKKDKEAAELRASEALKEAERQRRQNAKTTAELQELQAADPNGARPLADGVRDILSSGQDAVRSRRQP